MFDDWTWTDGNGIEVSEPEKSYFYGWSKSPKPKSPRDSSEWSPKDRPFSPGVSSVISLEAPRRKSLQRPRIANRGLTAPEAIPIHAKHSRLPKSSLKNSFLSHNEHFLGSTTSHSDLSENESPEQVSRYISHEVIMKQMNKASRKRSETSRHRNSSASSRPSLASSTTDSWRDRHNVRPDGRPSRSQKTSINTAVNPNFDASGIQTPDIIAPVRRHSSGSLEERRNPASHDHRWYGAISGHTVELRIRHKTRLEKPRKTSASSEVGGKDVHIFENRNRGQDKNPDHAESDIQAFAIHAAQSQSPRISRSVLEIPPQAQQKEGLYKRVWHQISQKRKTTKPPIRATPIQEGKLSRTNSLLDHASNLLVHDQQLFGHHSSDSGSSRSLTIFRKRKPPLVKHLSVSSAESSHSFRNIPPTSTPNPELEYTGSNNQRYMRVEISQHHTPAFLPSEATKIGTPPSSMLPGPEQFSYDSQEDTPRAGAPPLRTPTRHRPRISADLGDGRDWFRAQMEQIEHGRADNFDLDAPEHLPSSPLCPRHPKHPSKGNGVCVFHGRNSNGLD
jgi:hypothetical protein